MADWERNDGRLGQDWRGRDWRGERAREGVDTPRRFGAGPPPRGGGRGFAGSDADYRDGRGTGARKAPYDGAERPASYGAGPSAKEPDGAAAMGYGDGGESAYGQMASGSSDSGLGGYGGTGGGYGQPNLNSQWGAGGYGPLNQGVDYGHGGGSFGPSGYDSGDFGQHDRRERPGPQPMRHDEHHASYSTWRDTQLASHDRDYNRWREEQVRRYDEDYGSWRNERHAAFSKEFEGWRTGRGGQSAGPAPAGAPMNASAAPASSGEGGALNSPERTSGSTASPQVGHAHGANPSLARIADGADGHRDHDQHRPEPHGDTDEGALER